MVMTSSVARPCSSTSRAHSRYVFSGASPPASQPGVQVKAHPTPSQPCSAPAGKQVNSQSGGWSGGWSGSKPRSSMRTSSASRASHASGMSSSGGRLTRSVTVRSASTP